MILVDLKWKVTVYSFASVKNFNKLCNTENRLVVVKAGDGGGNGLEVWDRCKYTYRMDKQQGSLL